MGQGESTATAESVHSEVLVAVMGVIGAGKSTFIKLLTGRDDVVVGDHLTSETAEVHAYDMVHNGTRYILIDTPGFDDTARSDRDITEAILTWLRDSSLTGKSLNGVIYLHRITETRMNGTALKNFRMFRKLVGPDGFQNVVLATTFWETVPSSVTSRREQELRETRDFWGGMLERGAKMVQLGNTRGAGLDLIDQIAGYSRFTCAAEREMVEEGKSVSETTIVREQKELQERVARELAGERERVRQQSEAWLAVERRQTEERLRREKQVLEERRCREKEETARRQRLAEEKAERDHKAMLQALLVEEERRGQARIREIDRLGRECQAAAERAQQRQEGFTRQRPGLQENYTDIGCWPLPGLKTILHSCFSRQPAGSLGPAVSPRHPPEPSQQSLQCFSENPFRAPGPRHLLRGRKFPKLTASLRRPIEPFQPSPKSSLELPARPVQAPEFTKLTASIRRPPKSSQPSLQCFLETRSRAPMPRPLPRTLERHFPKARTGGTVPRHLAGPKVNF